MNAPIVPTWRARARKKPRVGSNRALSPVSRSAGLRPGELLGGQRHAGSETGAGLLAPENRLLASPWRSFGLYLAAREYRPARLERMRALARRLGVYFKVSGLVEGTGRTDGTAPRDVEFYRHVLDAMTKSSAPNASSTPATGRLASSSRLWRRFRALSPIIFVPPDAGLKNRFSP